MSSPQNHEDYEMRLQPQVNEMKEGFLKIYAKEFHSEHMERKPLW